MKNNKKNQAQKTKKTNPVEGINNLIEEKTQKEKLVDKTKKKAEANLVEEVVTKREVKYIYPADCEDTLSRKKFRQTVRNKIHQLELAMLRIENQDSKEFKKAKKEYLEYKNQFVKESIAI